MISFTVMGSSVVSRLFFLVLVSMTSARDDGLARTPPMGWMAWERFRCETNCTNNPKNCIRYDGLARTPPMGWMAWERFRCETNCTNNPKNCISEELFRNMADRLSEDGWRELGYKYLIIDDCWMSTQRDKEGRLQPDPVRFPGGIPRLARYVHDRGLKLGIYADLGTHTCMGFPGTPLNKIQVDAQTFASWGVDYLKFDGCYSNAVEHMLVLTWGAMGTNSLQETDPGGHYHRVFAAALGFTCYPVMSEALNATGRPIVYSCSWPVYQGGLPPDINYTLLGEICHLWRNYVDIQDSWDSVEGIIDWFFNNQDDLQPAAGPGRWNDPDMLIIGNFGLSVDQARSQMALWAIMASPLIMSNDLRDLDPAMRAILQNKLVIAINQDPAGFQGRRLLKEKSGIQVFWRPLSHSYIALVFLSLRRDMPYRYSTCLSKLNISAGVYQVYDVFKSSTLPQINSTTDFTVTINPSGVVMWLIAPETQTRSEFRGQRSPIGGFTLF